MFATPSYTKTVPLLLQPQWIYTCAAVRVNPTRAPPLSRSLDKRPVTISRFALSKAQRELANRSAMRLPPWWGGSILEKSSSKGKDRSKDVPATAIVLPTFQKDPLLTKTEYKIRAQNRTYLYVWFWTFLMFFCLAIFFLIFFSSNCFL